MNMMVKLKKILFTCGLVWLTGMIAFAADQKLMSVQVQEGHLRSKPSFLGKIVTTLAYGNRVAVLEEQTDWMRVSLEKDSTVNGWIHKSALTKKEIAFKAGSEAGQVSDSEIVIAGKGFNEQVEKEFKQKNPNLDYTWIDKMGGNEKQGIPKTEEFVVSQNKIQNFLKEGSLPTEGGSL
jgi:hypothetical protein